MSKILECVQCHKRTTDYEAEDRLHNPYNCGSCGAALREVADYSLDTWAVTYSNRLLQISLNHSIAVTQYAASILAAGPIKHSNYKSVIAEFNKMHKTFNKQYKTALSEANEVLNNGR